MSNNLWQGRIDAEDGDKGMRWHQKVNLHTTDKSAVIHGFECDLGVAQNKGRIGAAAGPDNIRQALANFAWHANGDIYDSGNTQAGSDLTTSQMQYADVICSLLGQHKLVIGLGGGHEIALGSYTGLANRFVNQTIGIINIDAHFDLRKPSPLPSSGTPFRQIHQQCVDSQKPFHYACLGVARTANTPALFDYAEQSGTRYLLDTECSGQAYEALLTPMLKQVDQLYLTICLDAFPASIAPGVSAPSALGISPVWVIQLIHWLAKMRDTLQFDWQLLDIAEMNPEFDQHNMTARLAARLIDECLHANFNR